MTQMKFNVECNRRQFGEVGGKIYRLPASTETPPLGSDLFTH